MAQVGFLYDGCRFEGYKVCHPYRPVNLITRVLREITFKFFPIFSSAFYNKECFVGEYAHIIVWDPLITKSFLIRLHKLHPKAQIDFVYWNMVGKCSHLTPNHIPYFVRKWTYDGYDSEKYGLKLYSTYPYYKRFIRPHNSNQYDVLFVGRDKGRGKYLLELENQMKSLGLKTKFIITKSDRLSKKKSYYQQELTYDEICDLVSHSRSVLNVTMDNQQGITLRDLEYVYQGVKLITTNSSICKTSIYHPNNVFVIGEANIKDLPAFLNVQMIPLSKKVIKHHTLHAFITEITSS